MLFMCIKTLVPVSLLLASVHQYPFEFVILMAVRAEMGFIKASEFDIRAMNNVFATYRFACGQSRCVAIR